MMKECDGRSCSVQLSSPNDAQGRVYDQLSATLIGIFVTSTWRWKVDAWFFTTFSTSNMNMFKNRRKIVYKCWIFDVEKVNQWKTSKNRRKLGETEWTSNFRRQSIVTKFRRRTCRGIRARSNNLGSTGNWIGRGLCNRIKDLNHCARLLVVETFWLIPDMIIIQVFGAQINEQSKHPQSQVID